MSPEASSFTFAFLEEEEENQLSHNLLVEEKLHKVMHVFNRLFIARLEYIVLNELGSLGKLHSA